jgi:hypothetical protein
LTIILDQLSRIVFSARSFEIKAEGGSSLAKLRMVSAARCEHVVVAYFRKELERSSPSN